MSETWLNCDKAVDFELNGYELNYMNREDKNRKGAVVCG